MLNSRRARVSAVAVMAVLLAAAGASGKDEKGPERQLAPGADATPPEPVPPGADVVVRTNDGMELAATFWDCKAERAAAAVLVHDVQSDRSEWRAFVRAFLDRKVSVLAVDLRGHGGSAHQRGVDLSPLAASADAPFVREMHADVIAAVRWLAKDEKCDARRIALVGMARGASIALDAAGRHPKEVAAMLCVAPPLRDDAADNATAIAKLPATTPLLLMSRRAIDELAIFVLATAAETARLAPHVVGVCIDVPRFVTADMPRVPLLPQALASFVAARTGSKTDDIVLDGIVEPRGPHADPWRSATKVDACGDGDAWAYRVGRRLDFGGVAPKGCTAVVVAYEARLADAEPAAAFRNRVRLLVATGEPIVSVIRHAGVLLTRDAPSARLMARADGMTFEGEWMLPAGAEDAKSVAVEIRFETAAPKDKGQESLEDALQRALKDEARPLENGRIVPSR